jgi:hypothetical protein
MISKERSAIGVFLLPTLSSRTSLPFRVGYHALKALLSTCGLHSTATTALIFLQIVAWAWAWANAAETFQ